MPGSPTACRRPRPRRSTPICWPSSSREGVRPPRPPMTDARTVLLAMDFQHDIVERIGDESVVEAASRAVEAARAAGLPVMFVRVAFRPGYPEITERNLA